MNTSPTKVVVSDVIQVSSTFSGDPKIILLSKDGQLVNTIQGRALFMASGSWSSVGEIIEQGKESGHYPGNN